MNRFGPHFLVFVLTVLMAGCGDRERSVTQRLIGVWEARVDRSQFSDVVPQFTGNWPEHVENVVMAYRFRYNEQMSIVVTLMGQGKKQESETPARWRVLKHGGKTVTIQIAPQNQEFSDDANIAIKIEMIDDNHFRRLDPSGKGRIVTFRRIF